MAETIRGITVQIGADTTGLSAALGDVNKRSKDIQSELKQIEKLLKLDPSNTELVAQKQKLLGDAVANTQSKLKTLRDAQEQVNQQFAKGEISEGQYRAFQRELVKTEQELKGLEDRLRATGPQVKTFADKLGEAGEKLGKFGDKTAALGKKLAPLSAAAAGVVGGMVGLAVKSGQAADEINTLAKTTGLATDTIQKFRYASDIIDVSLETLTGSLSKLTRNMNLARNGSKDTQAAFDTLGVAITDSSGNLRNNEAVFNDVIKALGNVANETERDALAMQIFGRSAQELNPLIMGGADALKELGEQAEQAGLILSQDALDAANKFNDEIDTLKATAGATFSQLGVTIGTALLPSLQKLGESAGKVMTWFRGLDESTAKTILTIAGLVAGIAPALIIIGKLSSGISQGIKVFQGISAAVTNAGGVIGMLTSPVGIAVAAIAGAIAIGVLLWKNWDTIKEKLASIWNSIKDTAGKVWDGIVTAIKAPINAIISAINLLIRGLNKIHFDIPKWVPLLGGKQWGFNIPEIPKLATGGIVTRPTLAMIGERGPEAVVPLDRDTGMGGQIADAVYRAVVDGMRTSGTGDTPPMTVIVKVGEDTLVDKVVRGINRKTRLGGQTLITV